ncbi:NUDIX hydrolase [Alphaproteobacteria bacterium]|nr:NUDIX hydrolase [Alphaproteobacteria bacterium]
MFGKFQPIFKTPFFMLEEAAPIDVDSTDPYHRIVANDSVIACILDQADNFVMVRQYRPSIEISTLESPAGGIERSETPIEAMRREIAEETGLDCALLPLGKEFVLMMNRTNIRDHLFFGMFPEPIPAFRPENGIDIVRVPRASLLNLALEGQFLQLGALGVLQLVGGVLKLDMFLSSYDCIADAFRRELVIET